MPSTITSYRWENFTFLGYYSDANAGGSSYRPETQKTVSITETRTFTQNAAGTFAITGTPYQVTKTSTNATLVRYVDTNTSPTLSSYQALVSANTEIQTDFNSITRAYGVGNIWMQIQSKTEAQ